jgi:hypothetical protein
MKRIAHFKGYSSSVEYDAQSQTFFMKTFSEHLITPQPTADNAAIKTLPRLPATEEKPLATPCKLADMETTNGGRMAGKIRNSNAAHLSKSLKKPAVSIATQRL